MKLQNKFYRLSVAPLGYDWEYFTFPACVTPKMIPYGENIYELVLMVSGSLYYRSLILLIIACSASQMNIPICRLQIPE